MTSTTPFSIRDSFPPVAYSEWRKVVEADLKGVSFEKKYTIHTYEGIDFQPLYGRRDFTAESDSQGLPGLKPFVRGVRPLGSALTGVDLRQVVAMSDFAAANRVILEDVAGGVSSLELQLDPGVTVEHLISTLADVDLNSVAVALESGADFELAANALAEVWRRRQISPVDARGSFNADPFATLARTGQLLTSAEVSLQSLARLANWTSTAYPQVNAVGVDTSPYHGAGATATQDIAFSIATAVAYLRAMTGDGMNVDMAARQILFRVCLGTHHFLAIGKLRALRQVWGRVLEASGSPDAVRAMRIQTRTGDRVLAKRDPYVNVLRNAACVFAAMVGGADVVTSVPLDHLLGFPDEASRRIARNTVLVLQEESHLHRVIDPAGGSWFLATITDELSASAWEIFQEIEKRGGMLRVLESGWVAEQIVAAHTARSKDIARRKEGLTGVSEFPNIAEEKLVRFQADVKPPATKAQSITQRLPLRRFAAPFEELRDAADAWQAKHGIRPRAFLANLGPVAHFTARSTFAKNFLEAGGIETISTDGFDNIEAAATAFQASGAKVAVICSSDKMYLDLVPRAAAALKAAGARSVVLAGNPGDNETAWREAGVDRFIFIKCDVLATLRELLCEEGVIES